MQILKSLFGYSDWSGFESLIVKCDNNDLPLHILGRLVVILESLF